MPRRPALRLSAASMSKRPDYVSRTFVFCSRVAKLEAGEGYPMTRLGVASKKVRAAAAQQFHGPAYVRRTCPGAHTPDMSLKQYVSVHSSEVHQCEPGKPTCPCPVRSQIHASRWRALFIVLLHHRIGGCKYMRSRWTHRRAMTDIMLRNSASHLTADVRDAFNPPSTSTPVRPLQRADQQAVPRKPCAAKINGPRPP